MSIATTENVHGHRVVRVLGLVRGNTIRARHIGKDIMAGFRGVVGGEISEYTKLMGESREQAVDRMVAEAEELGGNAQDLGRVESQLPPKVRVAFSSGKDKASLVHLRF